MKYIRIIVVMLFSFIIFLPMITFNFEENAISEIDNRKLTANPFSLESLTGGNFKGNIENYVNDRIGFRDEIILSYTILNDKLFNKMVHPSYTYGKDGYVFGSGISVDIQYTEYHETFVEMVKEIQDYCDARDVPFVFVFDPSKPAVLSEYIADGINYNRDWVDEFFKALDEYGIRYVDNTEILRQKTEEGEIVFNQKYDANHWNALGAYYGVNEILQELQKDISTVHVNQIEELTISQTLQTSLLVSEFPINEWVPSITIDMQLNNITKLYSNEIELHPSFKGFGYYINEARLKEQAPKALVFQGSYMNVYGYKYLENGFGEYIHVHDYQNVIDFPYYYNIFKPDCVIFEVAEYTLTNGYFNYEKMCQMNLNPTLESVVEKGFDTKINELTEENISVEKGEMLTKIKWNCDEVMEHVWFYLDEEYDMKKNETGYEVTILTEQYEKYKNDVKIVSLKNEELIYFQ